MDCHLDHGCWYSEFRTILYLQLYNASPSPLCHIVNIMNENLRNLPKFSLDYLAFLCTGIQLTQWLVLQMIPYVSAIQSEAKSVE